MLLRDPGRIDALLVAADRLVLGGVVGGEVGAAQRDERREQAERRRDALAQPGSPSRAPAADQVADDGAARCRRRSPLDPRREAGRRAGARRAIGITANASASRSGPAHDRHLGEAVAAEVRLRAGGDVDRAVLRARRGTPGRRAVDQQAVAQRHAAEPQLLRLRRARCRWRMRRCVETREVVERVRASSGCLFRSGHRVRLVPRHRRPRAVRRRRVSGQPRYSAGMSDQLFDSGDDGQGAATAAGRLAARGPDATAELERPGRSGAPARRGLDPADGDRDRRRRTR